MHATVLIAAKDLRLRVRDRSVFIIGIGAPLVLAFIFNLIFGNAFGPSGLDLEYGLVDLDGSEVSAAFQETLVGLQEDEVLTVDVFKDRATAESSIEAGEIDAFFVIPAGFGAAVESGSPRFEVVGGVNSPTSTQIATAIADQYGTGVEAARLAVLTTARMTGEPITQEFIESLGGEPGSAAFSFRVDDVSADTRQLDTTTYIAAGMAVFFMFFTVQSGVIGLLEEEREGTLARLFAAPITHASVVLGKAILSFALGVLSMGVLIVATTLLMGASWGRALGVALLVVTGVGSAVGLMGLVSAFSRSPEGAENLASISAVVLGMLGGVFFPLGQGEDLLSRLTLITPHAWFMRGLGELSGSAPWTAALPAAGVLAGFTVVLGSVGWWAMRRRLQ